MASTRLSNPTRRVFLHEVASLIGTATFGSACIIEEPFPVPSARAITRGPKYHWFGYYDKLEFDPTDRYVLGNEVDFRGRPPEPTDAIRLGMVDLEAGDQWIELGQTTAWNWQQGAMLQWIPSTASQVVWNDRDGDNYVARVLDVTDMSAGVRTLPMAIYCISPDGRYAFCIDYKRIESVRFGYGYSGPPDPFADDLAPEGSGIWKMDMATGETELIFSIADAVRIPPLEGAWDPAIRHWVYHLLVSPDGKRLAFLHSIIGTDNLLSCRLLTIDTNGGTPRVVDPHGKTSHYDWRDPSHLLAWSRQPDPGYGFYLFTDGTGEVEHVGEGVMVSDGHCTYLADERWILCDTYPDQNRNQHPYIFDAETEERYPLGEFNSPTDYTGEFRCDTHPRQSRDGRKVVIDSPHDGGRQMYLIDISSILDSV